MVTYVMQGWNCNVYLGYYNKRAIYKRALLSIYIFAYCSTHCSRYLTIPQ